MSSRRGGGMTPREKRERRRRIGVAVVALLAALGMILPTVMAIMPPARGATTDAAGHRTVASGVPGPVVLIGMSGVSWTDVTGGTTPALWELGTTSSAANLVVRSQRSSTCPVDGWLAVSAGVRAADVPMPEHGSCRRPTLPGRDEVVPGWADVTAAAAAGTYDALPGTLGATLADAGVPARGIGPGAAIALADTTGRPVGKVVSLPGTTDQLRARTREALATDPGLLVVDVGVLRDANRPLVEPPASDPAEDADPDPAQDSLFGELGGSDERETSLTARFAEPSRESQLIAIDGRVGAVLRTVHEVAPEATVLVASLADPGTRSGLRLVAAQGPGFTDAGPGLLYADSTRQTGLVQTFDLPSSVLAALEVDPPAAMAGSLVTTDPDTIGEPATAQHRRIAALADDARQAAAVPPAAPTFTIALIVANLLIYAAATLGLNRRVHDAVRRLVPRRGAGPAVTAPAASGAPGLEERGIRLALRALRALALVVAALPVSATLAAVVPWWRAGSTGWALTATVAGWATLIAALALLGPWRRWLLGPLAVVAAVTAGVLAVDVVTGSTLQLGGNVLGVQPQVGARFYGINNQSFALFVTSMLLLAMCAAEPLVRAGRRRAAGGVVLALGMVQVVVNGHPSLGADFGGPPAAVPGFLVLVLLAAGIRVTWRRALGIAVVAAAVVGTFAVADWLRPPRERTHVGAFVQTVLDGGLWDVVSRKLGANLSLLFGTPLTFLAIGGLLVLVLVLSQPLRRDRRETGEDGTRGASSAYGWLTGGPSILRLDRAAVMLRPGIVAIAVTLTIGFALNDSGIVIPALGLSLLVPLLIAVLATWLLRLREARAAAGVEADAAPQRSKAR